MSKTKKKKKHRLFWHFFRIQLVLLVLVLTAAAYYFYGGYGKQVEELKQEAVRLVRQSDVDTFKANQTSIVYASDGSVISTLKGEKDSYYVSIEEMPVDAVTAIVSIEDKKFFRHHGIDYRALLRAVKALAPYKCAVLPLSKKLGDKAMEIRNELSKYFMVDYDDTGSIGKRYRREDEIGTPYCITVDFDTVGDEAKGIAADNCVTVRDRDTMEQVRMPISELKSYIESKIEF